MTKTLGYTPCVPMPPAIKYKIKGIVFCFLEGKKHKETVEIAYQQHEARVAKTPEADRMGDKNTPFTKIQSQIKALEIFFRGIFEVTSEERNLNATGRKKLSRI